MSHDLHHTIQLRSGTRPVALVAQPEAAQGPPKVSDGRVDSLHQGGLGSCVRWPLDVTQHTVSEEGCVQTHLKVGRMIRFFEFSATAEGGGELRSAGRLVGGACDTVFWRNEQAPTGYNQPQHPR
eukprot:scaffold6949_cov61-Phaeocystis_antarctica.AAC.1